MANYQESNISGIKWKRCNEVQITNNLGTIPVIRFVEQCVVELGDGNHVVEPSGDVSETLTDPEELFNILDPTDDSITGAMQYQTVYAILYSLYRHVAEKRDQGLI